MHRTLFFILANIGFVSALSAQILVFVDESKKLDQEFINEYYPEINEVAAGLDIGIQKFDIREGAPEEVTLTPQIAFQNEYGRSFYVGRYSEISRFKVFLRTVARNPQRRKPNIKKDILSYNSGRSTAATPVKITSLQGKYTGNKGEFYQKALASFNSGFERFSISKTLNFKRTDRLFYLDIHPFVSEDGLLYLSYEIYSQFNCVVPVYSRLINPMVGKVAAFEEVFKQLGHILEAKVFEISSTAQNGDAFNPIKNDIRSKSWGDLGLEASSTQGIENATIIDAGDLSNSWSVLGAVDKITPIIQFNFLAPLDNYAGEVKDLEGKMNWNGDKLSGVFEVATSNVTMGEETYDNNVHKKYIRVKRFPKAQFTFDDFTLEKRSLIYDEPETLLIPGVFLFMGKEREIVAVSNIIPYMTEDGKTNLIVRAEFDLDIYEHSKVRGPDGPQEARKNMHFQLNFIMNRQNETSNQNNSNSK